MLTSDSSVALEFRTLLYAERNDLSPLETL